MAATSHRGIMLNETDNRKKQAIPIRLSIKQSNTHFFALGYNNSKQGATFDYNFDGFKIC
jgi:hypothetical protein